MLWGGINEVEGQFDSNTSVEVYSFDTNTSCQLPDLPKATGGGQAIGNFYCDQWECITFSLETGSWIKTPHILPESQLVSASWKINDEIIIFGSQDNDLNFKSTVLKPNGSVENGFPLKYGAR